MDYQITLMEWLANTNAPAATADATHPTDAAAPAHMPPD